MNNTSMTLRQYWRIVRKEATKKASQRLGFGGRILAAIVTTAAGILAAFVKGGNLTESLIWGLIGVGASLLVWSLVWFIYFSYYFAYEPATIHNSQVSEVEKLKFELNPEHPLEISIRPPEYPKIGRVNVGIDIRNTSVSSVIFTVSVRTKSMANPEILMPLLMHIVGDYDYTNIRLNRKTTFPFYFACTEAGWSNAILNTVSDNHRRIYPGIYELTIHIDGESINGKSITGSTTFILAYEGDDKLELRNP